MTFAEIPKVYNPEAIEKKWYNHWLKKNYFHATVHPPKKPYTIVIPPPNVTGSLTIGHVLNNTIQDVLIRRARMQGKEVCWVPGTDHASIATEVKITRMLEEKGLKKEEIGREEFLKHAWEWKTQYGSLIIQQLRRLGCSCDWQRERFTLDEAYSRAVLTAFVKLYKKGLIYRGLRLVNWDPSTCSAISDEEVTYKEVQGHLWYFRYPLLDSDEVLVVATTRPETMLGDTAVAVNPNDSRYQSFVGKSVLLPLVRRKIPVIADDFVNPEFGTGCVKVTPAHDPNDFILAKKHGLDMINIMNDDASLNENVPKEFQKLDRFQARKLVVERLAQESLVEKIEDYSTHMGFSDRGGVPIEPYLSEQWFMRMNELAKPALDAVKKGDIQFYPEHWVKIYEHWMENIQDWCISRQLWWGHRIPVWTHIKTGEAYCEVDPPTDLKNWQQDPDVLDTWASSWLWPFGVFNWPAKSEELSYFYPTNDLVTGGDIIFFWIARMIMSGIEFMGEVPFKNVYFHGMVCDIQGRKMSKSLGNSPDPVELMDNYGADALRYGIMLIAPQGQDILFSEERVKSGRNFMNKLWNAARFLLMNGAESEALPVEKLDKTAFEISDLWILSRLNQTILDGEKAFTNYRFNEVAKKIYDFSWSDYCDWYVEIIKSRLYGNDQASKLTATSIATIVMQSILKLLHPFAPFITEEIWQKMGEISPSLFEGKDLIISKWPESDASFINSPIESDFEFLQQLITSVRNVRSVMNVPPGKPADLLVRSQNGHFIKSQEQMIRTLAKVDRLAVGVDIERPVNSATVVVGQTELFIPIEGLIDMKKERLRLKQEIDSLGWRRQEIEKKLNNPNFLSKAPENVVIRQRQKLEEVLTGLEKLKQSYAMLE